MKNLHTKKTSNGINFGWLIRQMSITQKIGRKAFGRKSVSGSLFVSTCPPECNFESEMKTEPDLRLLQRLAFFRNLLDEEASLSFKYFSAVGKLDILGLRRQHPFLSGVDPMTPT